MQNKVSNYFLSIVIHRNMKTNDFLFWYLLENSIKLQRLQDIFALQQNLKSAFPKDHSLFLFHTGWEEQSITKNFLFFSFFSKAFDSCPWCKLTLLTCFMFQLCQHFYHIKCLPMYWKQLSKFLQSSWQLLHVWFWLITRSLHSPSQMQATINRWSRWSPEREGNMWLVLLFFAGILQWNSFGAPNRNALLFQSPGAVCTCACTYLRWNSKVQEGNLTDIPLGKANMFYDSCWIYQRALRTPGCHLRTVITEIIAITGMHNEVFRKGQKSKCFAETWW